MAFGGTALKLLQTTLYVLAFGCSAILLGIYSYFLAELHHNHVGIPNWERAVEGISGSGALYTIFAIILTCCLGGVAVFAFIAIVLDILFTGGFIAIAIMTRHGHSCSGSTVNSPLGVGAPNSHRAPNGQRYTPSLHTACRLNTACFAIAIIGAFLFFISAFVQLWLGRNHQKQKRYGPSPANNYTRGNGIRFFKRRRGAKSAHAATTKDAEAGAFTSGGVAANDGSYVGNKYEETAPVVHDGHHGHHNGVGHQNGYNSGIPTAGGYHTGPAGSAVNPYGYENRPAAHQNF